MGTINIGGSNFGSSGQAKCNKCKDDVYYEIVMSQEDDDDLEREEESASNMEKKRDVITLDNL